MYKRVLAAGIALAVVLLGVVLPSRAAPLHQWRSVITYPEPGMTVGGIVEIKGIATHARFDSYQVRYAPGSNVVADSAWVDIVMLVPNPVDNGVLCTWDTTTVSDGPYVLALAVWGLEDAENPHVHFVEHIIVDNSSFVPSPEPTAESEPAATVPAGPTATLPSIVQPPTSTPRSSAEPGAGEEIGTFTPTPEPEEPAFAVDTSMWQDAFCTGGLITVMLFLLWGLYMMAKASIRWYMRGPGSPRK
ncbi:MAG: hypothetical protein ACK2US_18510 [Anaerolineae bacterium]|jgi:hypothetical protein